MIHCYSVYVDILIHWKKHNQAKVNSYKRKVGYSGLLLGPFLGLLSLSWTMSLNCPSILFSLFTLSSLLNIARARFSSAEYIWFSFLSLGKGKPWNQIFFGEKNPLPHWFQHQTTSDRLQSWKGQWLPDGFHSPVPATRHHPAILR